MLANVQCAMRLATGVDVTSSGRSAAIAFHGSLFFRKALMIDRDTGSASALQPHW